MKNIENLEEIVQEIHYQVLSGGFPVDFELEKAVIYTLAGIPQKDRDYLIYDLKVTVMQFGRNSVMRFPPEYLRNTYVCFMSDVAQRSKAEAVYTVAHQFAHAFLGHNCHCGDDALNEYEADQQVIKWGYEQELRESGISYSIPGHKNYSEGQAMIQRYEAAKRQQAEAEKSEEKRDASTE